MSSSPTSTDVVPADAPGMTPEEIEERMQLRGLSRDNLTAQQEQLMLLVANGSTIAAAARAVGYKNPEYAYEMLNRPGKREALEFFKEQMAETVSFTRVNAHNLLMQAWTVTANATEMVKVVDSLTKLHGLNEPDPAAQTNIQVNIHNAGKVLENMSDEELMRLVGHKEGHLDPERD